MNKEFYFKKAIELAKELEEKVDPCFKHKATYLVGYLEGRLEGFIEIK